jgi:hypothetical protein
MKRKILIITFVIICIFLGAGSFFVGKYIKQNTTTSNKTVATQKISDNKSKLDILDTRSEQEWTKIQALAKQQGVIAEEAKDNESYNVKQPIRLSKNFYIILEKSNKVTYINGQSYVIADISLLNISEKDYYSTLANFTLQDVSGYTYQPDTGYKVTGDVTGNIPKGKGYRRGQIAFEVPYNQLNYALIFNAENLPENSYNIQMIKFKLSFPVK